MPTPAAAKAAQFGWKASEIVASQPEDRGEFFDPAESKVYRHPTFYTVPDGMEHM